MHSTYTALLKLDALDPRSVESAFIEVRAQSLREAHSIVEMFIRRPDVKISSIMKNLVEDQP